MTNPSTPPVADDVSESGEARARAQVFTYEHSPMSGGRYVTTISNDPPPPTLWCRVVNFTPASPSPQPETAHQGQGTVGDAGDGLPLGEWWMFYDHQTGKWCVYDDGPPRVIRTGAEVFHVREVRAALPPARVEGDRCHPSHVTRISMDASSYDEICVNCGATDHIGGWGALAKPCPKRPPAPQSEQPK